MKYNIAICGTFNVENYGDLMFPEVFKMAMQKRGLEFDMYMFSPGRSEKKALDNSSYVYSTDEIDEIHKKVHFDAVVIGGGALIHYAKIPVKLQGDKIFSDYKIYDSWYTPIEFAIRNNVKILFNLPQIPYNFSHNIVDITKAAFDQIPYISLRDDMSKSYAESIYGNDKKPDFNVYPDSVCCLPTLITKEHLESIRNNIDNFSSKYAIVHFNPQKPENEDQPLTTAIKALQEKDYQVILLPLGYTHNDDAVLSEFDNKYKLNCKLIKRKLNIFEMASLLAGCEIYIGASFHGAITAIAYGNKAISYNYIHPKNKNKEIFKMYGLDSFVIENATDLLEILDKILTDKIEFKSNNSEIIKLVDEHFDRLFNLITSNTKPIYDYHNFITPLLDAIPKISNLDYLTTENDHLNKTLKLSNDHINNITAILNQKSEQLEQKAKELNQTNIALNQKITELKQKDEEINSAQNQIEQLQTAVFNKETHINNLDAEIARLNSTLLEIRLSFFWRLTSPARKIMQKVKNFLTRHTSLLKTTIYLKGFLKGGFMGGTQRLESYKRFLGEPTDADLNKISKTVRAFETKYRFSKNIKFSVLVPLYNTPIEFLTQMIESVQSQTYKNWELCLADGSDDNHSYVGKYCKKLAFKDKRIKYKKLTENKGISENTNACIEMSTGDYIALFDHDDLLHPSALFRYMKVICEKDADFIYCDEDKFTILGEGFYDHNFKVDFAPDNLRANNYICHFTVFKKSLLELTGGFRKEFDGSQDHDLVLRLTEKAENIVHVPEILYHWRISDASVASDPYAKPYTIEAGKNAVREHLERIGLEGTVESSPFHPNIYKINYKIKGNPLVSILIPNYNHVDDLDKCIKSIINKSTYKNYEIIIIENNSNEETFRYYETLKKYPQVKVVVYETDTFNYSAINNYGARYASGEHIVLLNNDTEIISENWIEEMLMLSQREEVGIVGSKLYYPDDTIQHAGVILGMGGVAGHIFRTMPRTSAGYFGRAIYVGNYSIVTFACAMMKRSVFDAVGGLDESFAVAFNDVDMCMRVVKAGYLNCWTPFAELYHYESISRGNDMDEDKYERFVSEVNHFIERWNVEIDKGDAYYNKNLTLLAHDCSLKQPEEK